MMELIPIGKNGMAYANGGPVTDAPAEVSEAFGNMYEQVGHAPPWVGYIARIDGVSVGTCAFKNPPADGRVEIAYFTFPGYEGRGVATRMASALIDIARQADPALTIIARTLPEQNASTRVLSKLGFVLAGAVEDPEDGEVWEWVLQDRGQSLPGPGSARESRTHPKPPEPAVTCTMCNTIWSDLESLLTDSNLEVIGYQARFDRPHEGFVLTTHNVERCGTTIGISVASLRPLYFGPEYAERRTGSGECPGLCLLEGSLEECEAPCDMAWVRRVIQFMRRHELPPEWVGRD